jgi:hypothetical protein
MDFLQLLFLEKHNISSISTKNSVFGKGMKKSAKKHAFFQKYVEILKKDIFKMSIFDFPNLLSQNGCFLCKKIEEKNAETIKVFKIKKIKKMH